MIASSPRRLRATSVSFGLSLLILVSALLAFNPSRAHALNASYCAGTAKWTNGTYSCSDYRRFKQIRFSGVCQSGKIMVYDRILNYRYTASGVTYGTWAGTTTRCL